MDNMNVTDYNNIQGSMDQMSQNNMGMQQPLPQNDMSMQSEPLPQNDIGMQQPLPQNDIGMQQPLPQDGMGMQQPLPQNGMGMQQPLPQNGMGMQPNMEQFNDPNLVNQQVEANYGYNTNQKKPDLNADQNANIKFIIILSIFVLAFIIALPYLSSLLDK